ncbi:MAG: hypothetical protein JW932_09995 [Deltaproteobacteria bacterium]|nr:hypothetical protein [Deltaproteobacteria bacterium]
MKMAIAATGPNLNANIENRLGLAQYLIIVDTDTGEYDPLKIPVKPGDPGAGINIILLALEKDAKVIVAGYMSPQISHTLSKEGITFIPYKECPINVFLDAYHRGEINRLKQSGTSSNIKEKKPSFPFMMIKQTGSQFFNIMPILLGVVLLIGLARTLVKDEMILNIFQGKPLFDTIFGAFAGSIFTGNPINSYVIGDALLNMGVTPFAVTALLLTWVTVGLVQLPAEIAALGRSFGLARIVVTFVVSIFMALITGSIMGMIR